MIIRAIAPLRLGLAGGGTDVSPYSDLHGGAILNATINQFAYATILPREDGIIRFEARDTGQAFQAPWGQPIPCEGPMILHKGAANWLRRRLPGQRLGFTLVTYVDAPAGSGLGSSSTLVAAMLGAFNEWLGLALGEYELARNAFEVERVDLGMAGGKQDQYAATFGGINFMEFFAGDKVIVNPLRVRTDYLHELEACLLFYYTGQSRLSSTIIQAQIDNVQTGDQDSIRAMHALKEQAVQLKEALLTGQLSRIGEILDFGWRSKKNMAKGISNPTLDEIYETAITAGATGGKVSGAGGGGHMILFCPGISRYDVEAALARFGGDFKRLQFVEHGLHAWRTS